MPPPIIALVGKPDSGKTTLLEKLIPELNRRGYRVGTVKHHVHEFEMDREGKDTYRHKQAGARVVALSSPGGLGVIRDVDHDHAIEELLDRYFFDVDLVIAEGYKSTSLPKIEIFRKSAHDKPLDRRDSTWMAMVSDSEPDPKLPHLELEEIPAIADFIIGHFISDRTKRVATLLADGEPIPMNSFVESFFRKAILGMTSSLKGCDDVREISITVRSKYYEGNE